MYRKNQQDPTLPESFEFPSGGKLSSDNRWVIMAKLIPWDEFVDAQSASSRKNMLLTFLKKKEHQLNLLEWL